MQTLFQVAQACWTVLGQMAPYLLFGFLAAGILSIFISPAWVERHLGGSGLGAVVKASLFGVPLPLCSCSVLPVGMSIRRHGASKAATTAFLISTPQTGIDSILVTYSLLGPVFAVFRPLAAFLSGVLGGVLGWWLDPEKDKENVAAGSAAGEVPSGCAGGACCSSPTNDTFIAAAAKGTWSRRLGQALRHGFVTLPATIGSALLLGVLIAGAVSAFVPADYFAASLGGGIGAMMAMALAGMVVYVCSTASIPLALGLMHMGVSPGAAFVFLMAGPAMNAAGFTTVWKGLGRRSALLYLFTIFITALGSGLLLDALAVRMGGLSLPHAAHEHAMEGGWFEPMSAVALLAVLAGSWWIARRARTETAVSPVVSGSGETSAPPAADYGCGVSCACGGQKTIVLRVRGMSCQHCAEAVRSGLLELPGVRDVRVSLKDGRVEVDGTVENPASLIDVVSLLGYDASISP